jgi:hypothetical protein
MSKGAARRHTKLPKRRTLVGVRGIMKPMTRAVRMPAMTSGTKYRVHNMGDTPLTFWKLKLVEK